MNKKDKIILLALGVEFIIGSAVAIYGYGQYKFYEGSISKSEELKKEFEKIKSELNKRSNK